MATGITPSTFSPVGSKYRSIIGQPPPQSLVSVPIEVVLQANQLPLSFLEPSESTPIVVGFDCEGVDLARYGRLCVIQLAFEDRVYLVDVVEGGRQLVEGIRRGLESPHVVKVIHDCKRDSEALYFQFGIKLQGVFDTQVAFHLIEDLEGRPSNNDDCISFVHLLADERYFGVAYDEKQEVRDIMRQDEYFWVHRPWTTMMQRVAADDVRFLLDIHKRMISKLYTCGGPFAAHRLTYRCALHSRCFCIGAVDWPMPPLLPAANGAHSAGDEDQLFVVDVPHGKMGVVIGKRGASIREIKVACRKTDVITGGRKGPPDKVFVIGPAREVGLAVAMIRGRMW